MERHMWVYRPPNCKYIIAKRQPFGYYNSVLDMRTGSPTLQMVQGVMATIPDAWEWKHKEAGRTFAGFKNEIFDITDLEVCYFPRL